MTKALGTLCIISSAHLMSDDPFLTPPTWVYICRKRNRHAFSKILEREDVPDSLPMDGNKYRFFEHRLQNLGKPIEHTSGVITPLAMVLMIVS